MNAKPQVSQPLDTSCNLSEKRSDGVRSLAEATRPIEGFPLSLSAEVVR